MRKVKIFIRSNLPVLVEVLKLGHHTKLLLDRLSVKRGCSWLL